MSAVKTRETPTEAPPNPHGEVHVVCGVCEPTDPAKEALCGAPLRGTAHPWSDQTTCMVCDALTGRRCPKCGTWTVL